MAIFTVSIPNEKIYKRVCFTLFHLYLYTDDFIYYQHRAGQKFGRCTPVAEIIPCINKLNNISLIIGWNKQYIYISHLHRLSSDLQVSVWTIMMVPYTLKLKPCFSVLIFHENVILVYSTQCAHPRTYVITWYHPREVSIPVHACVIIKCPYQRCSRVVTATPGQSSTKYSGGSLSQRETNRTRVDKVSSC